MTRELQSYALGAAAIGIVAALSGGCTTEPTQVTDVWKDPSYTAGPMKSVAVIGAKLSTTQRRTLEDGFVAALTEHRVRAVASYKLFPDEFPTKDEARAALQQSGVDGILVATLKGTKETLVNADPGFWDGYYGYGWGSPYVATEPVVKFETSLWDPSGPGKIVWSAMTETENPTSGKNFTMSLTKEVIPKMTQAGFLPPAQGQQVSYAPEWMH